MPRLFVRRVAFAEIARGPEQYPITLDDVRKLVLRHFPYVIYFVVTPRDAAVGPEFFEPLPDE